MKRKYVNLILKNDNVVYLDNKKGYFVIESYDAIYTHTINFVRLTREDDRIAVWFDRDEPVIVYNRETKQKEQWDLTQFISMFSDALKKA